MRDEATPHGSPADRAAAILALAARAGLATPDRAAERLRWTPEKSRALDVAFEAKRQKTREVMEAALRRLRMGGQGGKP